jgi:predicted N-acetyltransferase YhbS
VTLKIRAETPADYDAIDFVECRAFGRMDEAQLARLMRDTYPAFDPELSIVAVDRDQINGHTLFMPAPMRMTGATVTALCVVPVCVMPERQRQGIGGAMLRHGHRLGGEMGYQFAFLLGHPSYYPRVGYAPTMGSARVKINVDKLDDPTVQLHPMPVADGDIDWLAERCAIEIEDVDFGWLWQPNLLAWSLTGVNSVMWWTKEGRRAGYTAAGIGADHFAVPLADDPELACEVIRTIKPRYLEHHPSGWLAKNAVDPAWSSAEVKFSDAAMAVELQPGLLAAYRKAVARGQRPLGFVNHPLPFVILG